MERVSKLYYCLEEGDVVGAEFKQRTSTDEYMDSAPLPVLPSKTFLCQVPELHCNAGII